MKILLCCFLAAALSGCAPPLMLPEPWDAAVKACEPYGGIDSASAYWFEAKVDARCKDGTKITVAYKEAKP